MSLKTFFAPKSVAVVGVSENPDKLGSIIFQNIIESGFTGSLYGVNPKLGGEKLLDKPCVDSVAKVEEALDLVVIVIPGRFSEAVIDDCIKNKTKNPSQNKATNLKALKVSIPLSMKFIVDGFKPVKAKLKTRIVFNLFIQLHYTIPSK